MSEVYEGLSDKGFVCLTYQTTTIFQYYVPLQITESVVSIADGYNVLTLTKRIKK